MLSMTGYGKAEYNENGVQLVVEIKTVNNRNFDLNAKMPRAFLEFENAIRKVVAEYVLRGRIDLFVNFADKREKEGSVELNLEKAKAYLTAAKSLNENLNVENDLTASVLLRMPEVLTENTIADVKEFEEVLLELVKKACENLNLMRKVEGEKLCADMLARIDNISSLREKIKERAPKVALEYKEKLKNRIEEALSGVQYDETRLLNEVAFYTDKVNIDEELTRLSSHIEQFKSILPQKGCGKKLDFLMQEFNRESNTICSKSNDVEVTSYALALKNEIEKVREQVQNLE